MVGVYREKENGASKKFKINVYTISADDLSTLVICLEDKSHTSALKTQKYLH
jgi:hypothetical protein